MLYYIFYSLSFLIAWGFLLLDSNKPGLIGIFIALLYTFYSSYAIRRFVKEETISLKIVKFLGPSFYFLVSLCMVPMSKYYFLYPINVGFLVFLIPSFDKNSFPKIWLQILSVFLAVSYSFFMHELINKAMHRNEFPKSDRYNFYAETKESDPRNTNDIPMLSTYRFLNANMDTIGLEKSDKYTIIETWNETHIASLRSAHEMQHFFSKLSDKASHFYIYIPISKDRRLDYNKIFNFEKIQKKEKILVDINLYKDGYISKLPTYLVFDADGKLLLRQNGYGSTLRNNIQQKIKSVIK
jgi:hypothetical protein